MLKNKDFPANIKHYRLIRIVQNMMKDIGAVQSSILHIETGPVSREGKKHNNMARLYLVSAMQELDKMLSVEKVHQSREQIGLFFRQES